MIATGRDPQVLQHLEESGADATISLALDPDPLQTAIAREVTTGDGVDVVLDYLYGVPTETVLAAIATSYRGTAPVRYVLAGGATGQPLTLRPPMLAPVPLVLMGSGIGSIPFPEFVRAAGDAVAFAAAASPDIDHTAIALRDVEPAWNADHRRSRVVFTVD